MSSEPLLIQVRGVAYSTWEGHFSICSGEACDAIPLLCSLFVFFFLFSIPMPFGGVVPWLRKLGTRISAAVLPRVVGAWVFVASFF